MNNYNNYNPEIPYAGEEPMNSADYQRKGSPGDKKENKATKGMKRSSGQKARPSKPKSKGQDRQAQQASPNRIVAFFTSPELRILWGITLGLIGVYLLVSFFSYFSTCLTDQTRINSAPIGEVGKVSNLGGEGGARLSEYLINECFGFGSVVIIVWLFAMCLKMLVGQPRFKSVNFTIKCLVALITLSLIVGLVTIASDTSVNWGGYHGRFVNELIINFFGWIGAFLLCIFMISMFVLICLRDLVNWIIKKRRIRAEKRRIRNEELEAERKQREEIREMQLRERKDDIKSGDIIEPISSKYSDRPATTVEFSGTDSLYNIDEAYESFENGVDLNSHNNPIYDNLEDSYAIDTVDSHSSTDTANSYSSMESNLGLDSEDVDNMPLNSEESLESEAKDVDANEHQAVESDAGTMVVNVNQIAETETPHFKSSYEFQQAHPYKFPPFSILRPGEAKIQIDPEEQLANKNLIEKTLLDFKIPITKIEATVGPTVTLYEIVPEVGVKIAKIRNLSDDIALRLSANGVRIIAPIPGKGTVGIEVPNKKAQTVSMRTVVSSKRYQENKYHLPVALGSTISNEVYITDLAKMPHLLVAGATGQGKSVGLNAIVASLLYSKSPSELKFVMIDPKQVEFGLYNKLKNHYMAVLPEEIDNPRPVVTDMPKVEPILNSLVMEMEKRYSLLSSVNLRNIEEYNERAKAGRLNPADGHFFMPYIVVVVDEFADLVMVVGKGVYTLIARLAQKARAVGIHVILATQRPSVDVITGMIKANFPARIAFRTTSGTDSKTILDTPGAQSLIGRGDMLIFNNSEMVRVQCAFIDTPEVESLCDYVEKQTYAPGPYLLPDPPAGNGEEEGSKGGGNISERDSLFEEIARRVVTNNTASTSSLQRMYSIGYNRAGKIMDQLEAAGIVGPSHGGKPRAVLVDSIQLENILSSY